MTIAIRPATPHDMENIAQLADLVFRSRRPGHMAAEFPHLYHPANAHHWYLAEDGGQIVSIVGAFVWPALLSGARTKVASIGSVATHPAYRRQGLAFRLLALADEHLVQEGVRLALISGNLPIYHRWGARSVGQVTWYQLPMGTPDPAYTVRPLDPQKDASAVARLYQTRATRFTRRLSLLRELLRLQPLTTVEQGIPVALIAEYQGTPAAYAIVTHRPFQGREPSRVTEWAGSPAALLALLHHVPDLSQGGLEVPVLEDEKALEILLADAPRVRQGPYAWLVKVIDAPGLLRDLEEVWSERSDDPVSIESLSPGTYEIRWGSYRWSVDGATLTEWLFQPQVVSRPEALSTLWPISPLWPEGLNYI
ncbi:MAG: GNAT family N-acetyltransferase [Firmicutes bacterium]|nr:GNAT family N-acetyltransferase [Bacillota bacterium]